MSEEVKRMNIEKFRQFGYLQELNRQFLHPLGLAIEVVIDDETGEESLGGVWDYRDDPEGIVYDSSVFDNEDSREKYWRVRNEWLLKKAARLNKLGYVIQEIPEHESTNHTE